MHTKRDLTQGAFPGACWGLPSPLILGNLLQQLYNLADTWVVGQFIGEGALAAVGSSYTLMTFLTSILLGLCMGGSCLLLHPIWPAGPGPAAQRHLSGLPPHRGHHPWP